MSNSGSLFKQQVAVFRFLQSIHKLMQLREIKPLEPRLAVSTALWHKGKFLLVERAKAPNKGLWALPGGKVRFYETLQEAALRELAEETGLKAKITKLSHVEEITLPAYCFMLYVFAARSPQGELRSGGDAAKAAWFDFETIQKIKTVDKLKNALQKCVETKLNF